MPDVDIDFFDRDNTLKLFKHTPASIFKGRRCSACPRDLFPIGFQVGIQCVPFPVLYPWVSNYIHTWIPKDLRLDPIAVSIVP